MLNLTRKAVSPVIAIVLLLMMTVAAAGAAYFWLTTMQSRMQKSAGGRIEAITKSVSTRVIAQATICTPVPPKKDLVAFWPFPEGSGCTTEDISDQQNNGTLGNSTCGSPDTSEPGWVSGKLGQALEFDGSNDWVNVTPGEPISDAIASSDAFTLSVWTKTTMTGLGRWFVGTRHYTNDRILGFNTDHARIFVRDIKDQWYEGTVVINDGEWHYVVGLYDDPYLKLYVDGVLDEEWNVGSYDLGSTAGNWHIGAREDGTGNFVDGIIDEVRIYNKSLSKEAIEALYEVETEGLKKSRVDITVYNAGTEEVPEGAWVANLKKDGTTVDSDSYNASKLPPEEMATLNFYFDKMKPNKEYTIELEGTATSTTVSC